MERKWLSLGALAVALAALMLAGCGGSSSSSKVTSIKVGYGYGFSVGSGPDKIGFDILKKKYGITANIEEMPSSTGAITALDRGDIQLLNVGMIEIIPAVEAGAKIRIILPAKQYLETVAVGRPGITSVKQLRHKAFLIDGPEGAEASFAHNLVKNAGLAVSDVSYPNLDSSGDRLVALREGRADAATLSLPDYQRLVLLRKGYTLLARAKDVQPRGAAASWAVQTSFIEKHPAEVQKIVDALVQGYNEAYTPAGRDRFLKEAALGRLKDADPRIAEGVYADYKANDFWVHGTDVYNEAAYDTLKTYWLEHGALQKAPAFSDLWDVSFWNKAVVSD